jgi:hypothetical protein
VLLKLQQIQHISCQQHRLSRGAPSRLEVARDAGTSATFSHDPGDFDREDKNEDKDKNYGNHYCYAFVCSVNASFGSGRVCRRFVYDGLPLSAVIPIRLLAADVVFERHSAPAYASYRRSLLCCFFLPFGRQSPFSAEAFFDEFQGFELLQFFADGSFRADADSGSPFQLRVVWVGRHRAEQCEVEIALFFLAFRRVCLGDWPHDGEQDLAVLFVHNVRAAQHFDAEIFWLEFRAAEAVMGEFDLRLFP